MGRGEIQNTKTGIKRGRLKKNVAANEYHGIIKMHGYKDSDGRNLPLLIPEKSRMIGLRFESHG